MTIKGRRSTGLIIDDYGLRKNMHSYLSIVKEGCPYFYHKAAGRGLIHQWYYFSPWDTTKSGLHFGATIEWRLLP